MNLNLYLPVGITLRAAGLFKKTFREIINKFLAAEAKHGWQDKWYDGVTEDVVQDELLAHLEKGDPRDVAIYCLILIWHGWKTRGPKK